MFIACLGTSAHSLSRSREPGTVQVLKPVGMLACSGSAMVGRKAGLLLLFNHFSTKN